MVLDLFIYFKRNRRVVASSRSGKSTEGNVVTLKIMEIASYRVATISGSMSAADDAHPVHKRFMAWLDSVGGAVNFEGIMATSDRPIKGGALVYGDYSAPEPVMSEFKQCLFVGQRAMLPTDLRRLLVGDGQAAAIGLKIEHTRPGLYAVCRFSGPYAGLSPLTREINHAWLPQTGYDYSGDPLIEFYHDGPGPEQGEHVTDLCFPLIERPTKHGELWLT